MPWDGESWEQQSPKHRLYPVKWAQKKLKEEKKPSDTTSGTKLCVEGKRGVYGTAAKDNVMKTIKKLQLLLEANIYYKMKNIVKSSENNFL